MMETSSSLDLGMDYSGKLTPSSPANFEFEQNGAGKVQVNSFQYTNMKPDSFTVDMERFTHLTNKDATLNSRINLQRSLSRKGSPRWEEKKMNVASADNEKDSGLVASSSSPRASLLGSAMPEKSMVVPGTVDQISTPQVHHQITIVTGNVSSTTPTALTAERRLNGKRFSFRRTSSSSSWTIDPRRILFFFATLSSMGTILLIYFTLSMKKLSTDDSMLD